MNVLKKLILSVFAVVLSIVWSVQATGLIGAVIKSLNDYNTTTKLIIGVSILVSIVGLILVWMGKISYQTKESVRSTLIICNSYFGSLIALVILYMLAVRDIKYVLLAEVAVTWIIWFFIMSCIRKEIERFNNKEAPSTTVEKVEDSPK